MTQQILPLVQGSEWYAGVGSSIELSLDESRRQNWKPPHYPVREVRNTRRLDGNSLLLSSEKSAPVQELGLIGLLNGKPSRAVSLSVFPKRITLKMKIDIRTDASKCWVSSRFAAAAEYRHGIHNDKRLSEFSEVYERFCFSNAFIDMLELAQPLSRNEDFSKDILISVFQFLDPFNAGFKRGRRIKFVRHVENKFDVIAQLKALSKLFAMACPCTRKHC